MPKIAYPLSKSGTEERCIFQMPRFMLTMLRSRQSPGPLLSEYQEQLPPVSPPGNDTPTEWYYSGLSAALPAGQQNAAIDANSAIAEGVPANTLYYEKHKRCYKQLQWQGACSDTPELPAGKGAGGHHELT